MGILISAFVALLIILGLYLLTRKKKDRIEFDDVIDKFPNGKDNK